MDLHLGSFFSLKDSHLSYSHICPWDTQSEPQTLIVIKEPNLYTREREGSHILKHIYILMYVHIHMCICVYMGAHAYTYGGCICIYTHIQIRFTSTSIFMAELRTLHWTLTENAPLVMYLLNYVTDCVMTSVYLPRDFPSVSTTENNYNFI